MARPHQSLLVAAGCPLIQVEEPPHRGRSLRRDGTEADLESLTKHALGLPEVRVRTADPTLYFERAIERG